MLKAISEPLKDIIDSFQHPFYVIDIESYKIVFANKACAFGDLDEKATCHLLTHHSSTPCSGEHICPINEVKKTKKSTITEHIHFDNKGNPRNMEVHGDPVFDEAGNVKMMIEYSFDITDRKKAEQALLKTEQELKEKLEVIEKFLKFAINRELKMVELKKQ
ncbi:MAG: PAS domain-containing protein [Candidatus Omnitrophota bacterium]